MVSFANIYMYIIYVCHSLIQIIFLFVITHHKFDSPQNQLAPTNSPLICANSPQPTRPIFVPTRPIFVPTRPIFVPTRPIFVPTRPTYMPTRPNQLTPHYTNSPQIYTDSPHPSLCNYKLEYNKTFFIFTIFLKKGRLKSRRKL